MLLSSFGFLSFSSFFLVLFVFARFYQRFLTCFPQITRVDQTNFLTLQAFVFDPGFEEHSLHLGGITTDELSSFPDLVFSSDENQHFVTRFLLGFSTRIPRSIGHMHFGLTFTITPVAMLAEHNADWETVSFHREDE